VSTGELIKMSYPRLETNTYLEAVMSFMPQINLEYVDQKLSLLAMTAVARVSIVEDDIDLLAALTCLVGLNAQFVLVGAYTDAESCIADVAVNVPDIILMDINLPRMGGIEAVAHIKQLHPRIYVLMCTSHEDTDTIFASLEAGATGYILKTESPQRIISAMQELLAGGSPMTGSIARKVVERFNKFTAENKVMQLLSERELAVLTYIAKGMMNKEVADELAISVGTVRKHIQHIYEKLHVNTRVEAVNLFLKR
jgi:DNA-binding NarL/FixJ family response regulator